MRDANNCGGQLPARPIHLVLRVRQAMEQNATTLTGDGGAVRRLN